MGDSQTDHRTPFELSLMSALPTDFHMELWTAANGDLQLRIASDPGAAPDWLVTVDVEDDDGLRALDREMTRLHSQIQRMLETPRGPTPEMQRRLADD